MKIGVIVDGSRRHELAHARVQAGRLRRAGFGVMGFSRELTRHQREAVSVLHAVGPGAWRSARRLAKRSKFPVAYDHPPGAVPPGRLKEADVVIASSYGDATALRRQLGKGRRLVIVPPDPPRRVKGIRPRLQQRLGIGSQTIAIQEAAVASYAQAEALIRATSALADVDLVFLGGDRWDCKEGLMSLANNVNAARRIHFFGDIPSARRDEYLGQADVGLALVDKAYPEGRLPASDIFDMLGIPYVTSTGELGPQPENPIAAASDPVALRGAIVKASERLRMPVRDDGAQILEALILDMARAGDEAETADAPVSISLRESKGAAENTEGQISATELLERAKFLRNQGDSQQALGLYLQVADDSHPPDAVASAAAGLARMNARGEAQAAIARVMGNEQRSALATVRIGEAAALLGDLTQARACVDEVLAQSDSPFHVLRTAIRVLEQSGEPRAALRIAREVGDELSTARVEGVLLSYDPSWLPASRSTGRMREPIRTQAGRSVTLLETSLPHVRSGYTYRAQTLLRAQQHAGIEPTVLTRLGFPVTRGLSSPATEEVNGVLHHRTGLPGVKSYTSVPISEQLEANVAWAVERAHEIRPEGIVATTPHLNGLVGLALRRELGVPLIYDVRGFPEMTWAVKNGGADTDVFGLRRVAETRCMREADLVTTLSETMRSQIISRGIAEEKIFVLPHAVDTAAFAPMEPDRELAVSLGLAERPVIGYISSLVAYEGVETLLDAIELARQKDPSIAGLIVGSGELLPSLEAQAKHLGLDDHVVFTGRVDANDVSRFYSLTNIFVCPRQDHEVTRYVTPLKPFEAMAAGCCVVVSDLPTLREAVRDGECGALFPPGNAEALAATILDLIDRPERQRELMTAAREHAVTNHGFDALCTAVEHAWGGLRLRAKPSHGGGRMLASADIS